MNWKCPECGSLELTVSGVCEAYVNQRPDGSRPNLVLVGGIDFDLTSLMTCCNCSYCDASASFVCEDKLQRPIPPGLVDLSLLPISVAGINAGLFFDSTGNVRTIQHAHSEAEILISFSGVSGQRYLRVAERKPDGAGPSYLTEYYPSAKDIEPLIGSSGQVEGLIDLPGKLAMPDAMRIAMVYHREETDLPTRREAIAYDAIGLCAGVDRRTFPTCSLDATADEDGALRIKLKAYVDRPTLVKCFYENWVWVGNTYYDDEAPDGVNDIRELESFKRARQYAESLGYLVEFI